MWTSVRGVALVVAVLAAATAAEPVMRIVHRSRSRDVEWSALAPLFRNLSETFADPFQISAISEHAAWSLVGEGSLSLRA